MFDIVMPLFNKAQFVGRTIESVLAQEFAGWHLYIIDDGSSDDSVAVARRFEDPRISLQCQANAGPGAARNAGILAGKSEWIAFLDADDLWMPDHLAVLDRLREQFPAACLIGTSYRQWTGGEAPAFLTTGSDRLIRYFHEASRERAPFFTSSAAFRRSAIEKVGPLEHVVVGDEMDLWARLALHGPVASSTRPTVLYRVGTGGITDSNRSEEAATLEQLSLPVATLMRRLDSVGDSGLRQDITDYIDYEIGLALLMAVRTGRIVYARRLLKMFIGKPLGKARIAAILARLPAPIGQSVLRLISVSKRLLRLLAD